MQRLRVIVKHINANTSSVGTDCSVAPVEVAGSTSGSAADALSSDVVVNAGGISAYGKALRKGEITVEATARGYLERIAQLNPRLQCFQHVAASDTVLAQAAALDSLLSSGTDLGPLMGVPVAIKDIVAVDGMPTTNGSLHDSADITGPEGRFVQMLRRAGCLILGKVKTTEFAASGTGINEATGTPVNPHGGWQPTAWRWPGGSSSGSGVAVAAGLCAFAIGSDTGGSVRIPASFNGVVGHKTTVGLYPTDGVFPLSTTLDTLGPLCSSVSDAVQVHSALCGGAPPVPPLLAGLKLGLPLEVLSKKMDPAVQDAFNAACAVLRDNGCIVKEVELRDYGVNFAEAMELGSKISPPECLSQFGPPPYERFLGARDKMDTAVAKRISTAMEQSASQHAAALRKQRHMVKLGRELFDQTGCDCFIMPTTIMVAGTMEDMSTPEGAVKVDNVPFLTRPANIMGLCALSIPLSTPGGLPAGFQIVCAGGKDDHLLAIGLQLERVFPQKPLPQLGKFL